MDKNSADKIKNILDGKELPEKRVKIEKKDKGLFERTDVTILTEDNKIMLTD